MATDPQVMTEVIGRWISARADHRRPRRRAAPSCDPLARSRFEPFRAVRRPATPVFGASAPGDGPFCALGAAQRSRAHLHPGCPRLETQLLLKNFKNHHYVLRPICVFSLLYLENANSLASSDVPFLPPVRWRHFETVPASSGRRFETVPLLPGDAGFSLPARCRCPCVFPPPCRRLRKFSLSRSPPFSPSNGASPDPGVRKRPSNPPSPAPRKMSPSPFFQEFPSATKCSDVTANFFCRPSKKLSDRYVALSHALSRAVWAKNKSPDATAAKPSSANRDAFLDILRPRRARRRSPLGRRGLRTCGNAIASPG